jgi:hypothetical protein
LNDWPLAFGLGHAPQNIATIAGYKHEVNAQRFDMARFRRAGCGQHGTELNDLNSVALSHA